ncbi:hypothetical protein K443DRAFT_174463 [Laccaria amethystina LaAM-08-1]|uniref:Uncharacterized protein n=1 Tax=Laccaria amethystina LaAM-08-1 TaxID=1095629 RepID=A0A0C9XTY9_9AGAR|nr:hypothetical protein K443DRAFT_174463 [Laccaria amethystina LaAM-08-1]
MMPKFMNDNGTSWVPFVTRWSSGNIRISTKLQFTHLATHIQRLSVSHTYWYDGSKRGHPKISKISADLERAPRDARQERDKSEASLVSGPLYYGRSTSQA